MASILYADVARMREVIAQRLAEVLPSSVEWRILADDEQYLANIGEDVDDAGVARLEELRQRYLD